jgi:hypothetical protein
MRSGLVNLGLGSMRLESKGASFLVEAARWHVEKDERAEWQGVFSNEGGGAESNRTRTQECSIETYQTLKLIRIHDQSR